MTYSQDKRKYNVEYTKSHYKRIPLDVTHEKYDQIKNAAVSKGESVNGFIKRAIDERLDRIDHGAEAGE